MPNYVMMSMRNEAHPEMPTSARNVIDSVCVGRKCELEGVPNV